MIDSVSFTSHLRGDLVPERVVAESRTTFVFTKEVPFVGFFSYSDENYIYGLSFISYTCSPPIERKKKIVILSTVIPIVSVFFAICCCSCLCECPKCCRGRCRFLDCSGMMCYAIAVSCNMCCEKMRKCSCCC